MRGEIIAEIRSPDLQQEMLRNEGRIELLKIRLRRITADRLERSQRQVLLEELQVELDRRGGLVDYRPRNAPGCNGCGGER